MAATPSQKNLVSRDEWGAASSRDRDRREPPARILHRVLGGRAELEDPEIHLRDYLVAHAPGVAGGEEPALTQAGVLRAGDVGEFR